MPSPKLIAICGAVGSGKSEVQRILEEEFDVARADDGWPLRDFAIRHLGATYNDVHTQAGKLRTVTICGKVWTWREVLGEIGNRLEGMFGDQIISEMAVNSVLSNPTVSHYAYSFGSVRKRQGLTYRKHGGIVLEVTRDQAIGSAHAFDLYDRSLVTHTICNEQSLASLRELVIWLGEGKLGLVRRQQTSFKLDDHKM